MNPALTFEKSLKMNELVVRGEFSLSKRIKRAIYRTTKRSADIMFGIIGLIPVIPLAILIKICYLFQGDHNPIIYKQKRIGKNGKEFELYKFRSMVHNADEVLDEMLKDEKYKKEWEQYHKFNEDKRITKIGKFLRNTSIDELPQFINVLKGDMSLIGNRPYLISEKEDMQWCYYDIVKTTPGISGLWQVSGRSKVEFEDRLKIEQYYSNNATLTLDLKILFKTFFVVLKKVGAR